MNNPWDKVQVRYMKADPSDGNFKEYKRINARYISRQNKLILVSESYDVFCEELDTSLFKNGVNDYDNCDNELIQLAMITYIRSSVSKSLCSSYYQSSL